MQCYVLYEYYYYNNIIIMTKLLKLQLHSFHYKEALYFLVLLIGKFDDEIRTIPSNGSAKGWVVIKYSN